MGFYQGRINAINHQVTQKKSELRDLLIKIDDLSEKADGMVVEIKSLLASAGKSDTSMSLRSVNNNSSSDILVDILLKKGAITKDGKTYEIMIGNTTYKITPQMKNGLLVYKINYGKRSVFCSLYQPNDGNLTNISSTITLLGGDGEYVNGSIGKSAWNPENVSVPAGSILIAPFSGSKTNKTNESDVMACSSLTEYLFASDTNNLQRRVICHSDGALVATRTINNNPGYFTDIAFINGATTQSNNCHDLATYSAFKDMNVTYVITQKGWGRNGHASNDAAKVSAINLANSHQAKTITFISNDEALITELKDVSEIDTEKKNWQKNNSELSGHGNAWYLLNNLLSIDALFD